MIHQYEMVIVVIFISQNWKPWLHRGSFFNGFHVTSSSMEPSSLSLQHLRSMPRVKRTRQAEITWRRKRTTTARSRFSMPMRARSALCASRPSSCSQRSGSAPSSAKQRNTMAHYKKKPNPLSSNIKIPCTQSTFGMSCLFHFKKRVRFKLIISLVDAIKNDRRYLDSTD